MLTKVKKTSITTDMFIMYLYVIFSWSALQCTCNLHLTILCDVLLIYFNKLHKFVNCLLQLSHKSKEIEEALRWHCTPRICILSVSRYSNYTYLLIFIIGVFVVLVYRLLQNVLRIWNCTSRRSAPKLSI